MMNYSYNTTWIIVAGLALGSWLLRFSFLGLIGSKDLPEWLKRHLRYTVMAVLPGIIAPLVFLPKATGVVFDLPRFLAAAVTLGVGLWTKNLFFAVITGCITLYMVLNISF